MVSWRAMRVILLIPILMLGGLGIWAYMNQESITSLPISVPFLPTPTPTREPMVEGATSIMMPEVNPVLHISPVPVSLFAPAPAPSIEGQPQAASSYLEQFRADYEEYYRKVNATK